MSVDSEPWSVNNNPSGRDEPQYRMQETGCMIPNNHASQGNPQSAIRNQQLEKAEFAQKTMKLQMPFISNNGQVDDRVVFYANTFSGTVFVTKDGEIVYTLPNNSAALGVQSLEGKNDRIQNTEDCIVHPASCIMDRGS